MLFIMEGCKEGGMKKKIDIIVFLPIGFSLRKNILFSPVLVGNPSFGSTLQQKETPPPARVPTNPLARGRKIHCGHTYSIASPCLMIMNLARRREIHLDMQQATLHFHLSEI